MAAIALSADPKAAFVFASAAFNAGRYQWSLVASAALLRWAESDPAGARWLGGGRLAKVATIERESRRRLKGE